MSKLAAVVATLQKRPLSAEEAASLKAFQKSFDIDDDDPLVVVLAMMALSQVTLAEMPNLLQQKAAETIEMHRIVLRDQSIAISKELVTDLVQLLQRQIGSLRSDVQFLWLRYVACFSSGVGVASGVFWALKHFAH